MPAASVPTVDMVSVSRSWASSFLRSLTSRDTPTVMITWPSPSKIGDFTVSTCKMRPSFRSRRSSGSKMVSSRVEHQRVLFE